MGEIIRLSSPPLDIRVTRRANARRITLRIGAKGPAMTMPPGVSLAEGEAFALAQSDWLAARLETRPDLVTVGPGTELPVEGEIRSVVAVKGRGCRLVDGRLEVGGRFDTAPARIGAFLKTLARDRLVEAADGYAAMLNRAPGRITLRDTRSRWGSCTSRGDLMFSWRLILAPPEILQYVAAHEAAHLVEMNHSPAFWGEVERIFPGYQAERRWLRENGPALHRYRFT